MKNRGQIDMASGEFIGLILVLIVVGSSIAIFYDAKSRIRISDQGSDASFRSLVATLNSMADSSEPVMQRVMPFTLSSELQLVGFSQNDAQVSYCDYNFKEQKCDSKQITRPISCGQGSCLCLFGASGGKTTCAKIRNTALLYSTTIELSSEIIQLFKGKIPGSPEFTAITLQSFPPSLFFRGADITIDTPLPRVLPNAFTTLVIDGQIKRIGGDIIPFDILPLAIQKFDQNGKKQFFITLPSTYFTKRYETLRETYAISLDTLRMDVTKQDYTSYVLNEKAYLNRHSSPNERAEVLLLRADMLITLARQSPSTIQQSYTQLGLTIPDTTTAILTAKKDALLSLSQAVTLSPAITPRAFTRALDLITELRTVHISGTADSDIQSAITIFDKLIGSLELGNEQSDYYAARVAYKEGRYTDVTQILSPESPAGQSPPHQTYLTKYPTSPYLADVQFMIALLAEKNGNDATALLIYAVLVEKDPGASTDITGTTLQAQIQIQELCKKHTSRNGRSEISEFEPGESDITTMCQELAEPSPQRNEQCPIPRLIPITNIECTAPTCLLEEKTAQRLNEIQQSLQTQATTQGKDSHFYDLIVTAGYREVLAERKEFQNGKDKSVLARVTCNSPHITGQALDISFKNAELLKDASTLAKITDSFCKSGFVGYRNDPLHFEYNTRRTLEGQRTQKCIV